MLALGGRHLDVGQAPEDAFVVMADPEGNAFCVIEPGNGFLAGTGFLGEVACDGLREVGVFWCAALGWPLVWDQDERDRGPVAGRRHEGRLGRPLRHRQGRERPNPQRFELAADAAEVERLLGLGATRLGERTLADPDGNELRLS